MLMRTLRPYVPKQRYSPLKVKHEENLQLQICQYLKLQYPHIIFRSDYSSGLHLTMNQAVIHKRLQSGRSFPDLFVYKMSRGYAGLAIELKKSGTTIYVSRGPHKGELVADPHIREQALLIEELNRLGYLARFGIGFEGCKRIIDFYLNPQYKEPNNGELF